MGVGLTRKPEDIETPFAPVPVSVRPTNIRLGSWFQSRPRAVKIVASIGVLVGLVYFFWRLTFTSVGVNPWLFWPLFLAEVFGFLTFLMLVYEAWDTPPTPRPKPIDVETEILITTFNEDIDIVEPTVVGALAVRGKTRIWLCDDGRRPEMRSLAEHYGINYEIRPDNKHAKAGNVNAVLPKLSGDLILVLDADHVPAPDLLEAMSGYFADDQVALVQSAHSFRNHNSVMHEETGRHEQSLFFDVLLPGRNRWGSVFWCGSAALIRRSALVEVGGVATRTSTEDFETSLLMQMRGYKTRYHNEHLIQGLAPDNLAAYVTQRARWAQGTLSAFRPGYALPLNRNLSVRQRISYVGAFLYYITPLQRLVYTTFLILVGVFGVVPVAGASPEYLALWGLYVLSTFTAVAALERGSTQPFEGVRNTFLSMEAFLRALPVLFTKKTPGFKVTPKNEVDLGGWDSLSYIRVPLLLISINAAVLSLRLIDQLCWQLYSFRFLPEIAEPAILAISVFAGLEILVISLLAVRLFRRKQLRKLWRFPVRLNARLASEPVTVIDLHQLGAAVLATRECCESATELPLEIDFSGLDGNSITARGKFTPRNRRVLEGNTKGLRVGGEIEWNTPHDRTIAISHCYIVEPFRARNRYWQRRSPRVQVLLPATLADLEAEAIDLSIGGVGLRVRGHAPREVGEILDVRVTFNDQLIDGRLVVRDARELAEGLWRIGGEVEWEHSGWLNEILRVELVPISNRIGVHGFARR